MPQTKLKGKTYVKCEVAQGMFSSEYFVKAEDSNGNKSWGFIDKGNVKLERELKESETVAGLAQVHLIEEYKDKYLIQMPTEHCDRIFIPKDRLELFV